MTAGTLSPGASAWTEDPDATSPRWRRVVSAPGSDWLTCWLAAGTVSASSAADEIAARWLQVSDEWSPPFTSRGCSLLERRTAAPVEATSLLHDIRGRSGLTWQQLARVFGVDRRSLHLWAKGARLSAEHAERLQRIQAIVRRADAGNPESTRHRLLTIVRDQYSVLDLLAEGRDSEAVQWLARPERKQRPRRRPPTLSAEEHRSRQALSPVEILDARHDDVPRGRRFLGATAVPDGTE